MPRATSLAAELKEKYKTEPKLISSGGGVFEIQVDGKMVFSKKKLGRFPESNEVQSLMDAL
ncbi:MAG: Rdx family protein [SAR324 cluster bacterium]|nr:Rdx family protein [SAR324 cluster bacterium]